LALDTSRNMELMYELNVLGMLINSLVEHAEKLAELRTEGRVSDSAYGEAFEDLREKAEVIARDNRELLSAAVSMAEEIDDENKGLRHQLELLEVRYDIGLILVNKYAFAKQMILDKLTENEETKKSISDIINGINENSERLGQYTSSTTVTRPQDDQSIKPVRAEARASEPSIKPYEGGAAKPEVRTLEAATMLMVKRCPRCQFVNLESSLNCYNCGATI